MTEYICLHCKQRVERDSTKAWVKSYCSETHQTVHLVRVDRIDKEEDSD